LQIFKTGKLSYLKEEIQAEENVIELASGRLGWK